MTDIDLLPSQSDLLRKVQSGIMDGPAFIIINGEQGAGKTELARVLADGKVDAHGTWNTVLFEAKRQSRAADVRRAVINSLCGAAVFDPNDPLSETAKIFGINKKNCAVIIDSIDYFDRNFLNELYAFWHEFGAQINMSVVVTTSHLLRNLIKPKDGSQAKFVEFTFTRLTEGEKRQLITKTALRLYGEQSVPKGNALDAIVKETQAIPAGIVSYMEKHDPSDTTENGSSSKAETEKKIEPAPDNSKIDAKAAIQPEPVMAKPQVMHRTKAPSGPNKAVVIAAACVLSLALAGVIAMLLMQDKETQTPDPEEVVAATTIRSNDDSGESIKIADADSNQQQVVSNDEILIDQGSLNDALNGANPGEDGEENTVVDNQEGTEDSTFQAKQQADEDKKSEDNEKTAADAVADTTEDKIKSEAANAAIDAIAAVDASSDAAENGAKSADAASSNGAADDKSGVDDKARAEAAKMAQKVDEAKAKADVAKSKSDADEQAKAADKLKAEAKAKAEAEAKAKAESESKAKADAAQKKADAAKQVQKKEQAPKVGEVKPLAPAAGSANTGAFVVQIACDSNKAALEGMIASRKLGSSAYIYERNHKLKYVLVVGGYSSRAEADAAAKHFGQGAWVKSVAAVKKESK